MSILSHNRMSQHPRPYDSVLRFGGGEESISLTKGIRGHRLDMFGDNLVDKLGKVFTSAKL